MGRVLVNSKVLVKFDQEADAAYIYLVPLGPDRVATRSVFVDVRLGGASIVVDLAADGTISGFEILGASRVLPNSLLGEDPK